MQTRFNANNVWKNLYCQTSCFVWDEAVFFNGGWQKVREGESESEERNQRTPFYSRPHFPPLDGAGSRNVARDLTFPIRQLRKRKWNCTGVEGEWKNFSFPAFNNFKSKGQKESEKESLNGKSFPIGLFMILNCARSFVWMDDWNWTEVRGNRRLLWISALRCREKVKRVGERFVFRLF